MSYGIVEAPNNQQDDAISCKESKSPMSEANGEQAKPKGGLLAKIKNFFGRGGVPEETQMLISGVNSISELRRKLDEVITENEVNAGQIERQLLTLGEQIEESKNAIKSGSLIERAKINALRAIKRLNTRVQSSERRLKIYQDNIDLHYQILNQVDEMEAMELKAIRKEQVDEIALDYEEHREVHRDLVNAVRSTLGEPGYEDLLEKQELAKLEADIMAELGELETPEAEAVTEAVEPKKPVVETKAEDLVAKPKRRSLDELMASNLDEDEVEKRQLEME